MSRSPALAIGDLIEIKYRMSRPVADGDADLFDRWIAAEIIDSDPDAWPLARLTDGQMTDIRPFMEWRVLNGWTHRAAA
ncbi:MAG: hypothetical protein ACT4OU_09370 [Hyphomicrobium sp.]